MSQISKNINTTVVFIEVLTLADDQLFKCNYYLSISDWLPITLLIPMEATTACTLFYRRTANSSVKVLFFMTAQIDSKLSFEQHANKLSTR